VVLLLEEEEEGREEGREEGEGEKGSRRTTPAAAWDSRYFWATKP